MGAEVQKLQFAGRVLSAWFVRKPRDLNPVSLSHDLKAKGPILVRAGNAV